MDIYMLVLRLIHVSSGVFWAGGAILAAAYISPAAADAGDAGPKFMGALLQRGYSTALGIAAGLALLSGALMYWRDSAGFTNQWNMSGPGLVFTIGAIFGIIGAGVGFIIMTPAARKLMALGAEVAKAGGPPSPQQGAEMGRLSERLSQAGRINALALAIAVICMGTARYIY